jgi:predicted ATP-grasp superfamily ATP-dependent carboligase
LRVFACEYLTGGGLAGQPLPARLVREGDIMLRALAADLAELPGVEVVTTRDRRLPDPKLRAELHWIDPGCDPWSAWSELIAGCDAAWPVAPETGGALLRWSELIVSSGCTLIGSPPEALRVTMSKQRTAVNLAALGIPVVPTVPLVPALRGALPPSRTGWVVKPDDGAGTEETSLLHTLAELHQWAQAQPDHARFVVQPYVHGTAASLSLICCRGRATLLACNLQHVRLDERGTFRYCGGVVAGREARRAHYEPLAARIAAEFPELWGCVGIDLIDGADGPLVLEINARLTTSYAGLRQVTGINPAALVLGLLSAGAAPTDLPRPVREHLIALDAHAS